MFQGDENDFVIVSLVRSNNSGRVGFLKLLNRRCVAQSRSRCGLYMIGNATLLRKVPHWATLITSMQAGGCYGDTIELVCPKHYSSKILARTGNDITLQSFCSMPCLEKMTCLAKVPHPCPAKCQPPHSHNYCKVRVLFEFDKCGHETIKECGKPVETMTCKDKCVSLMNCRIHKCTRLCGVSHTHNMCVERVDYNCPKCGHSSTKLCHQRQRM